jgi:hypothetical protein
MHHSPSRIPLLVVLAAMTALGAGGCGKKETTVSGKVLYKGQTLPSGSVVFVGAAGRSSLPAEIQPDGTYLARNVPAGPTKVAVETPPPPSLASGKLPAGLSPSDPEVKAAQEQARRYVPVPRQYSSPNTSGLTFDVKPGANTHDITLQ